MILAFGWNTGNWYLVLGNASVQGVGRKFLTQGMAMINLRDLVLKQSFRRFFGKSSQASLDTSEHGDEGEDQRRQNSCYVVISTGCYIVGSWRNHEVV